MCVCLYVEFIFLWEEEIISKLATAFFSVVDFAGF